MWGSGYLAIWRCADVAIGGWRWPGDDSSNKSPDRQIKKSPDQEALDTPHLASLYSVRTEGIECGTDAGHGGIRAALGGDGHALGGEPDGGADPRAALHQPDPAARRGDRHDAAGR